MATPRARNPHRTNAEVLARNEHGEKMCNCCRMWLPLDKFRPKRSPPSLDFLDPKCRDCDRFRRHNVTKMRVIEMLADQGNRCGACPAPIYSFQDFEIDHDHQCCPGNSCGKCVRGLVCKNCNFRVLALLDDIELVERACAYLGRSYG